MNSHIAITFLKDGKQHPLVLPEDFSIDIDDQNPLFNDNDLFTYPVQMPLEGNRFLLGNIDDPFNIERPVSLEHTKMRIVVDNQPFRSGTLVTSEDEEIEGSLTMNIAASEHSIDELIGTLNCRDVPLKDKIQIGEKIGNVRAWVNYGFTVKVTTGSGKKPDETDYPKAKTRNEVEFTPQALGFSYPAVCKTNGTKETASKLKEVDYGNGHKVTVPMVTQSFINVSEAYPAAKYCNARVAYKHYGLDDEGKTSSDIAPRTSDGGPCDYWPYWVLDADRPQSGICFYVLYFLDCLFSYLGVTFDNSELMKVDDMRRLCFFTTHCKFDEEPKYPSRGPQFNTIDDINQWLSSRGCGGKMEFPAGKSMQVNDLEYVDLDGVRHSISVGVDDVTGITVSPEGEEKRIEATIMNMYATSENFPSESVQTVIDSLFASFGIKFDYDYEQRHVRAYFVRDVFRSKDAPIDFPGEVISMRKVAEKITGVRVCYSEESSSKEQRENVKKGERSYNTDYDYIDYPERYTVTDKTYEEIFRRPRQNGASSDRTCYIDRRTGNAYRIKVNGDAKSASELKPSLLEVGAFKGVELGDCSELNEDYVEEISSDFVPMVFSDVNYQQEISDASGTLTDPLIGTATVNKTRREPILAALFEEDMQHEFVEQRIRQTLSADLVEFSIDLVLSLPESYDPSDTSSGNSPLQEAEWGLAIAIMRGGGTDAKLQEYDFDYDGFGNSKWRSVAGVYALTSDSMDMFGEDYDYNGTGEGIGGGERFSLKIRAWKQPEWAASPLVMADETDAEGNLKRKIKSRGLFETFLADYAYFIMNRRKFIVEIACTSAQVADVPQHWARRFRINGLVGFINKLSYSIGVRDGMSTVIVEFFVV